MKSNYCSKYLLLVSLLAILHCFKAAPQDNSNIDATIRDLFSVPSSAPSQQQTGTSQQAAGSPQRRPFNSFVTPEPIDSAAPQPTFNSISGKPPCNCVAYHLCDPTTNIVAEEGSFDGFGQIDIRFNNDDPVCDHFLDVCCDNNRTQSVSLNPTPQVERPNRPTGCGIRNVGGIDFSITGANDNEAGFGEFPWTVALLHAGNNSYFCAGSLIHPRVVLTAVHCVISRPLNSYLVRAGEWDAQTTKERLPFEERAVQRVITHPQYNSRNVANDFALIILSNAVPLGDHINVICLPSLNAAPAAGTTCFSTGWGKDIFGNMGRYSAIMKRVPLPIVEFGSCQQQLRNTRLGQRFALDRSFICAGGKLGIDTCQGDGGAPLVCPIGQPSEQRYEQSGIVAWGIGCNDQIPAAYANVAAARNWIDDQMLTNGFDTSTYLAA